jgi:membrane protease YdiL (CAAX protease family)
MERTCPNCAHLLRAEAIFCGNCGKKIPTRNMAVENSSIRNVFLFYVAFLIYAIVSWIIYSESEALITEIILEGSFIMLTVLFSLFDARRIIALYNTTYITWRSVVFSVVFPVITAFLVYFGIEYINILLDEVSYNIFYDYIGYDYSFFWAFLFIAIVAPVFEELAFRGFLFNQLGNVTTPQVTILATAILFALVHFSFISFLWIFPFGIVLGYLRHKYKTLWLGMLVHFIHNLLVLLMEYYYFNASDLLTL